MENIALASIVLVISLFILLGSGVWIALSILCASFLTFLYFTSLDPGQIMAATMWDSSWSWALTALPLFIWMGEILTKSGLSSNLFSGIAPWVSRWPGRLLHINVLGCGIMAAVSGSSAVTCATVGRMSIPELVRRNYDTRMIIGSLAGSGTFGLLIPPSIILIVYGVIAQQSIARLFIAGIVPGLMLIALFSSYICIWSILNPSKDEMEVENTSFTDKLKSSKQLLPVFLLIGCIIGSIYGGFATPTEAASIGIIGALLISIWRKMLTKRIFIDSLLAATKTSCMIGFIIICAASLSIAVGFADLPRALAGWVNSLNLSSVLLIVVLTVFYLILGCFLEGISILVLTTPVVLPMIMAVGIDPIWFGIYAVIVIEVAQITPPLGFNLIVLKSLTGRSIYEITLATLPFLAILLLAIVLIVIFPEIVTFLPTLMLR